MTLQQLSAMGSSNQCSTQGDMNKWTQVWLCSQKQTVEVEGGKLLLHASPVCFSRRALCLAPCYSLSKLRSVARSRVAKHVYENHIEQKNIYFKQNTLKLIYPVRYS